MNSIEMIRFVGVALIAGMAAGTAVGAPIADNLKIGGFAVGSQAWTFNRFSVFEAIEKNALAGAKVIELFPGQKLSAAEPDVKFDHNASPEVIAKVKAKLAEQNVQAVNYGVVNAKGAEEWRRIFEMGKQLGLYAITTESVDQLDTIEKLVKEYGIAVGIHNHPRQENNPNYKVWDPKYVLSVVQNRDARIGSSADTGHWATSGVEPMEALKVLKGRITSVHLKDRQEIGKPGPDQVFGAGKINLKAILDELKAQGFKGNISIEYETKWDNNVGDVAQCIGFFRGYGTCGQ